MLSETEKTFQQEEVDRDRRVMFRQINTIFSKVRTVVKMEARKGKPVSQSIANRYLITPQKFFEKTWVRLTYASLIRRYRQVRLHALTECLCIAHKETNKDELIKKIRDLVIETGQAHKDSKKQLGG